MDHGPGAGRTRCGAMANVAVMDRPTNAAVCPWAGLAGWGSLDGEMRVCYGREGKTDLLLWRS